MPTPIDSVEEFKASTSNQTADFNNSSGMQVSIVTKRGTNAWHGTAYEYYLDNTLSGNTWQNNQTTPLTPVPDWHRSWFGVAGGGPLIPKDVLGGKTYIFANYQGARFPLSETLDRLVPSANMRMGILQDPSTGTMYNLKTLDPRGIGVNSFVQRMWNNHMPLPTPGAGCGPFTGDGICDGVNTLDFKANLAIPQNDNFGVMRVDHDFGQKWHFMSSFRYYDLTRATDDQVDVGGFFSGDKLGTPASLTNRPQKPWYLVLGMTTSLSSNVTNDFRYSFLRNYWQWGSAGDPAQFSGLGAALEPFGETTAGRETLAPYNVNAQNTRTRFWDGKDHFFRDDVSWSKGTHLLQFGGQYQHNWNFHERTDNGGGINYYPVYQLGAPSNAGAVDLSGLGSAFINPGLARDAAAVLGIVTETQQAFTRSGSNLTLNGPLVPAFDQTTIPYYNIYLNDTWHSPGLIQPVSCTNVLNYTTAPGDGIPSCNSGVTPNVNTAFRIGTDGTTAPLTSSPVSQTLPQPYFPGVAGNTEGSTASPLDPHFKPNSVDSFDFTIQHQFTPKLSIEVGAISRWIHNELQNININAVPYMMTKGGQQFQTAYANVEKAMGCATSAAACSQASVTTTLGALQPQAFFESALSGTGSCSGFANCTAAVVTNEFTNFQNQNVWTLWSDLDKGGTAPGFNFPFSMMNTAGQMTSNVTMSTSLGHGNYNAGFITVKMNGWHGVTLQNNFTYSKALGTGAVVQATSQETAVDPYNLNTQYGPQAFDRKLVDTLFLVFEPPYYRGQQGLVGHVLGGWTFSPIFSAGSGAPDFCITNAGNLGAEGYSGSQEFGSGDGLFAFTNANCVLTSRAGTSASVHNINGVPYMFANPQAVFNNVRPVILGLDGNSGGFGQFRGLPYWNVNLGAKKNIRMTERFSAEASFNFINVLNHNQFLDPTLNIVGQNPQTFGQLSTEGTLPRTTEFGIRVRF
jgi:hypothetical protein